MLQYRLQTRVSSLGQTCPHGKKPSAPSKIAYLVTDSDGIYTEVRDSMASSATHVEWFRSGSGYLNHTRPAAASCLLVSTRLPDMSGFDMLRKLMDLIAPPIILLSENFDTPSCVRAIREGAHDFFPLSLIRSHLPDAITTAFERDEAAIAKRRKREDLRCRWRSLTSREAEVMRYAVGGFLNKQTAAEMRITENTVQVHRGRAMRKMRAESFAAFVRMALKLSEWGEDSLLCP